MMLFRRGARDELVTSIFLAPSSGCGHIQKNVFFGEQPFADTHYMSDLILDVSASRKEGIKLLLVHHRVSSVLL